MSTSSDEDPNRPSQPEVEEFGRVDPPDWKRYLRLSLWGIVAVIMVLFLVWNSDSIRVSMVFTDVELPLFVVLLIAMAFGSLLTLLTRWVLTKHKDRAKKVAGTLAADFKRPPEA